MDSELGKIAFDKSIEYNFEVQATFTPPDVVTLDFRHAHHCVALGRELQEQGFNVEIDPPGWYARLI